MITPRTREQTRNLMYPILLFFLTFQVLHGPVNGVIEEDRYKGCGGIFSQPQGSFSSPNYPNLYPDNLVCSYVIRVDPLAKVKIDITDLDIEGSTNCNFDRLIIRDGIQDDSPILRKTCGRQTEESIISTQSAVLVQFITDQGVNRRGFKAEYQQVARVTMLPPANIRLPSPWTILETPKNIQQMDSGVSSSLWAIDKNNEVLIYMDQGWDVVEDKMSYVTAGDSGVWGISPTGTVFFREGVSEENVKGTRWKMIPNTPGITMARVESGMRGVVAGVTSKGELMFRESISSSSPIGTSWRLVGKIPEATSRVDDVSCGSYGCFIKTALGNVYFTREIVPENPETMKWIRIPSFFVKQVTHGFGSSIWALDLSNNLLQLTGMTLISSQNLKIYNELGLRFTQITNGLRGTYGLREDGYVAYNKDVVCGGLLTEKSGETASPNYSNLYPGSVTCLWVIRIPEAKSITYTFQEPFEVGQTPLCRDLVATFRDGKYPSSFEPEKNCGNVAPGVKRVAGNELWVEFHSAGQRQGKGMKALYEAGFTELQITTTAKTTLSTSTTPPPEVLPHGWQSVSVPTYLTGFDTGHSKTLWGFGTNGQVFTLVGNNWQKVNGDVVRQITSGGSGVWAINRYSELLYRQGVTEKNPIGLSWTVVSSEKSMREIDSGPSGFFAAVNFEGSLLIREGITAANPTGTEWTLVLRGVKKFSVGSYGIWMIDDLDHTFFGRIRLNSKTGKTFVDWARVEGNLREVDSGFNGQVWGIKTDGVLVRRMNVNVVNPEGTNWEEIGRLKPVSVTSGVTGTYIQLKNGNIFQFDDLKCGGLITQPSGTIQSPNYPSSYPNSISCLWIIKLPVVKEINVRFDDFNLENSFGCQKDKIVSFKEGHYMADFEPVFECGDTVKDKNFNGNSYWLEFNSDKDSEKRGFSLSYYGTNGTVSTLSTTTVPQSTFAQTTVATTPVKHRDCTEVLTEPRGIIQSPGYPSSYYPNLNCFYVIKSQRGKRVRLRITDFALESHSTCLHDWFEVYDGATTSGLSLGRYCGSSVPLVFTSSGSDLTIGFHTNAIIEQRGFALTWENIEDPTKLVTTTVEPPTTKAKERLPPGWTYIPSPTSGKFKDISGNPNGELFAIDTIAERVFGYSNGAWKSVGELVPKRIASNIFNLWALDLNGRVHYITKERIPQGSWLQLGDETFKDIKTGAPYHLFALKDSGELYFRSNASPENPAGRTWKFVRSEVIDVAVNSFRIWIVAKNGEVLSAPIPLNLESTALDWEPVSDIPMKKIFTGFGHQVWAIGRDGTLYYRGGSSFTNSLGNRWIVERLPFSSLSVSAQQIYGLFPSGKVAMKKVSECGGVILSKKGSITSPRFPANYPNNVDCLWIITIPDAKAISIRFTSFDLESSLRCEKDFLLLYKNGKHTPNRQHYTFLCEQEYKDQKYDSNEAWIMFHSDSSKSATGFRILYDSEFEQGSTTDMPIKATTAPPPTTSTVSPTPILITGCGGTFTGDYGRFGSPNYPASYPNNVRCIYQLVTSQDKIIKLDFEDFDIEGDALCRFDFIHIRDGESEFGKDLGKYCGSSNTGLYLSTGNKMWVFFRADGSVGKRGFKARWRTEDAGNTIITTPESFTPKPVTDSITTPGTSLPEGWSAIVQPEKFKMVDSGTSEIVWALHQSGEPYILQSYYFAPLGGRERFRFITAGESGVWGITTNGRLLYRVGVAPLSVDGVYWKEVDDSPDFQNIDSGPNNVVVAVDANNFFYQRYEISADRPQGRRWTLLDANIRTASVGSYGYWFVDVNSEPFFAPYVTPGSRQVRKRRVEGHFREVQAGFGDSVWAIGTDNSIYRREGINSLTPMGISWRKIEDFKLVKISSGLSGVFGITPYGQIVTFRDRTCGGILRSQRGTISTPNYPLNYPTYTHCLWVIQVPDAKQITLKFNNFRLQESQNCDKDYIFTLRNGRYPSINAARDCGNEVRTKVFDGSQAWIEFVSDSAVTAQGFEANYVADDEIPSTTSASSIEPPTTPVSPVYKVCGGTIIGRNGGQIAHPQYPEKYESFMDCKYRISVNAGERIQLKFLKLALEDTVDCSKDYLEVRDGSSEADIVLSKVCGTLLPGEMKSSSSSLFIQFRSDGETEDDGFLLEWRAINAKDIIEPSTAQPPITDSQQGCGGIVTGISGVITHQGYPGYYRNDQDCTWKIVVEKGSRIQLAMNFFKLEYHAECQKDYIIMYDGPDETHTQMQRLCGDVPSPLMFSSKNVVTIRFVSDSDTVDRGFQLLWKRVLEPTTILPTEIPTTREACGGIRSGNIGFIAYPTSLGRYKNNEDCLWTINTRMDTRVRISFDSFLLEYHPKCEKDYVVIYDGPDITYPLIQRLCGEVRPSPIVASANTVTVRFVSDSDTTNRGFMLSWQGVMHTTIQPSPATPTTNPSCSYTLTGSEGDIYHRNYPQNYKPNQDCTWRITVSANQRIKLRFLLFRLEEHFPCQKDYMAIYDGPSFASKETRLCRNEEKRELLSLSNSLILRFVSDATNEALGFYIKWNAVAVAATTPKATTIQSTTVLTKATVGPSPGPFSGISVCSRNSFNVPGEVTSPNHPGNYPARLDCSMRLIAPKENNIVIEIISFDLEPSFECRYDSLSIVDEEAEAENTPRKYCGATKPPTVFTSTGNSVLLTFQTDGSGSGRGFKLMWRYIIAKKTSPTSGIPPGPFSFFPTEVPSCGGRHFGQGGTITAPQFSRDYQYTISCIWIIETGPASVVNLNFQSFDLGQTACADSYVIIRDGGSSSNRLLGKFCERNFPTAMQSSGNQLWIEYKMQGEKNKDAFVINWNARNLVKQEAYDCGGIITGYSGAISSPSFPNYYPHNIYCRWLIIVPRGSRIVIRFSYFDMEDTSDCQADYVKVIDGDSSMDNELKKACGRRNPDILTSTNNAMWIEMRSDCKIAGSGFRAIWRGLGSRGRPDNNGGLLGPVIPTEDLSQFFPTTTKTTSSRKIITSPTTASPTTTDPTTANPTTATIPIEPGKAYLRSTGVNTDGGLLIGLSGIIRTPNYPSRYPINARIIWILQGPPNGRIRMKFRTFDLEEESGCRYDHVQIRNGASSDAEEIGRFCGSRLPANIESASNSLWVRFKSDASLSRNGFEAEWEWRPMTIAGNQAVVSSSKPECGGLLNQQAGRIRSPGYPENYQPNVDCIWVIKPPRAARIELIFRKIDTEDSADCIADFIEVRKGDSKSSQVIGRLCGSRQESRFISEVGAFWIRFKSDSYESGIGFEAEWITNSLISSQRRFKRGIDNPPRLSKCGSIINETSGRLTLPSEAKNSQAPLFCRWIIKVPANNEVSIRIIDLLFKKSQTCERNSFDIFVLYKGKSALLFSYCSAFDKSINGYVVRSQEKELTILYKASKRPTWKHFNVRWDIYPRSINVNGIASAFTLHGSDTGCGGVLTNAKGSLQSPNFPKNYPVRSLCVWRVGLPDRDKSVKLTFNSFNLEDDDKCRYDYLLIRDGDSPYHRVIGKYCGYNLPSEIRSSGNSLYLEFYSDNAFTASGFQASYESVDRYFIGKTTNKPMTTLTTQKKGCGKKLEGSNGQFTSPNYPGKYPRRAKCSWSISSANPNLLVLVEFQDFLLEHGFSCQNDFVEVRNGDDSTQSLGRFCGGEIPSPVMSSSLLINFETDESHQSRGFRATWRLVPKPVGSVPSQKPTYGSKSRCGGTESGFVGVLKSSNYPSNYENNQQCQWSITSQPYTQLQVRFSNFDVEYSQGCLYDYLAVHDGEDATAPLLGKYCGQEVPGLIVSSSNSLFVVFSSDESDTRTGFYATWVAEIVQEGDGNFLSQHQARLATSKTDQESCGGALRGDKGIIKYPTGGGKYPKRSNCVWNIEVRSGKIISMRIMSMDIEYHKECKYDRLIIKNGKTEAAPTLGRFCGTTLPNTVHSSSSVARIEFQSDSSSEGRGFLIQWDSKDMQNQKEGCGGKVSGSKGTIVSPSYGTASEKRYICSWEIEVPDSRKIKLTFKDLDIRAHPSCGFGYVQIHDGASATSNEIGLFCGSFLPRPIITNGNKAVIGYFSDSAKNTRGFQLAWEATTDGIVVTKPPLPNQDTPCDAILTRESGTILMSIGRRNCTWTIKQVAGRKIILSFRVTNLSPGPMCDKEYLEVSEGLTSSAPVLLKVCGQLQARQLTTYAGVLRLSYVKLDASVGANSKLQLSWTSPNNQNNAPNGINTESCGITVEKETTTFVDGRGKASVGSLPWVAALSSGIGRAYCGASLISQRWLLTAAHCFERFPIPSFWEVIVGEVDLSTTRPGKQILLVQNIYLHPSYNPVTRANDIAVVQLSSRATFNERVNAICIADKNDVFGEGTVCSTAGWGSRRFLGNPSVPLIHVRPPLVSQAKCNSPRAYNGKISAEMICAGRDEGGVDSCQGDGGGPISCKTADGKNKLLGISSWGNGCAFPFKYGVYTDVRKYLDWIFETMRS